MTRILDIDLTRAILLCELGEKALLGLDNGDIAVVTGWPSDIALGAPMPGNIESETGRPVPTYVGTGEDAVLVWPGVYTMFQGCYRVTCGFESVSQTWVFWSVEDETRTNMEAP